MNEKLQVLSDLGFTFSDEELSRLEEAAELDYADLLGMLGMGSYDFNEYAWTPTSNQVYALDTEVFDVGNMYPLFFQGLLSISGDELPITDVKQDETGADLENGTGTIQVSLLYDGRPYTFELAFQHDWLDCNVLKEVNRILEQEGVDRRFYACWNSFQGMTIFFRDEVWAKRFEKATGCALFTAPPAFF